MLSRQNSYAGKHLLNLLPTWMHPRFPLVAAQLRTYSALDFQIQAIRESLRNAFSTIYFILLFFIAVVVVGGGRLFGFFLFPAIIVIAPAIILWTIFLFNRLMLITPDMTSEMIAGETERRTWEILLSIPMARYQIILSKFVGLLWNAEPTLTTLMISRIVLLMLMVIERFIFADNTPDLGWMIILALFMAHTPVMEFYALSGLGMMISSMTYTWAANILTRSTWIILRFLPALIFIPYYVDQNNSLSCLVILMLMVPHWTHALFWLLRPDSVETSEFLIMLASIHTLVPAVLGTAGIMLTIHLVDRRWR